MAGANIRWCGSCGKERDAEDGLDNFGARYNSSTLGRFMTPDWAAKATAVPYAVFGDPQTLNLYAYVENAPVNRADADGHAAEGLWQSPRQVMSGNLYSPSDGLVDEGFDASFTSGDSGFVLVNGQFQQLVGGQLLAQNPSTATPTSVDIQSNIRTQADDYGIPQPIALATAAQESSFDVSMRGGSGEVGLFQIMPSHKGEKLTDASGKSFKLDFAKAADPKQWQYNVKAGLALLKKDYDFALAHAPNDVARATYAHYNAPGHWRQLYTVPHGVVAQHVADWMVHYRDFGGQ